MKRHDIAQAVSWRLHLCDEGCDWYLDRRGKISEESEAGGAVFGFSFPFNDHRDRRGDADWAGGRPLWAVPPLRVFLASPDQPSSSVPGSLCRSGMICAFLVPAFYLLGCGYLNKTGAAPETLQKPDTATLNRPFLADGR
jgi:hypothetical protein